MSAATDAGACVYVDGICETCSGETDGTGTTVDNDSDNDEVCDADEVIGCQDVTACNYMSAATDAGSCVYVDGICETCSGETDGTGMVLSGDVDEDGVCDVDEVVGCQDVTACNYMSAATDAGACVYVDGICETCSGETDGTGTTVDHDSDDDGVCDADEVVGCQILVACNYNSTATDAGSCTYAAGCESCSGATDGSGTIIANDDDGDGVCNIDEVPGCEDAEACNYDVAATDEGVDCFYAVGCEACSGEQDGTGQILDLDADDDGICDADEVIGCSDVLACNYDVNATDSGPCYIAGLYYDCNGECLSDMNENGICDEIDALIYLAENEGFTDGFEFASLMCDGEDFCGEGTVWSDDFQLCVEDTSCPGDLNGDDVVGTGDLLILLMDYGFLCD